MFCGGGGRGAEKLKCFLGEGAGVLGDLECL